MIRSEQFNEKNDRKEWGSWSCPHQECFDGRLYEDPDDIYKTSCDQGHIVNLGVIDDQGNRDSWLGNDSLVFKGDAR